MTKKEHSQKIGEIKFIIKEVHLVLGPPKQSLWKRFDSWLCSLDRPWIDAILEWEDRFFIRLLHFENFCVSCLSLLIHLNSGIIRMLWDNRDIPVYRVRKTGGASHGSFWYNDFSFKPNYITLAWFAPEVVTTLLHEMGHKIDLHSPARFTYSRGGKFFGPRVRKEEKRAWSQAIELSKKYGIPMNAKYAAKCLASYGTKSARLNNMLEEKPLGEKAQRKLLKEQAKATELYRQRIISSKVS